jgi:hypothetical protein
MPSHPTTRAAAPTGFTALPVPAVLKAEFVPSVPRLPVASARDVSQTSAATAWDRTPHLPTTLAVSTALTSSTALLAPAVGQTAPVAPLRPTVVSAQDVNQATASDPTVTVCPLAPPLPITPAVVPMDLTAPLVKVATQTLVSTVPPTPERAVLAQVVYRSLASAMAYMQNHPTTHAVLLLSTSSTVLAASAVVLTANALTTLFHLPPAAWAQAVNRTTASAIQKISKRPMALAAVPTSTFALPVSAAVVTTFAALHPSSVV